MRAPLVFCVAAVFPTIFVASRGDDEDHEIQNSTTTRDVGCKEDCTKLLLDQLFTSAVSPDEEDDYKRRGRVHPSRIKRRATHRSRAKPNARSRNSTRGPGRRDVGRVPVVRSSNKTVLYENNESADATTLWNRTDENGDEDDARIYVRESFNYDPFHEGLESLLARLIEALENNSREDEPDILNSSAIDDASGFDDEDRCQKWLNNREKIETAFPGSVADLPGCPCLYPNSIFYNNQIWDSKRDRKFRWRDVSHDKDRIAIYKPGAVYCVQTLPSQENESAIVQHCCYDESRRLLTRGSGAGTPYIVSPDVSPLLHDKIDLLPWRLCKGDFTRYNEVRIPNNDNDCEINPDNEEYQHQVERAKNY
ncbi:uncharacterized protein [Temnothorax longispinosus]